MKSPSRALAITATAAFGGLLFGFDIAIITGAGPFLEARFNLSPWALGIAFSALLFGCVVGSAIAGWVADTRGRRSPLLWVAVLFAASSIASGLSPTFTFFVMARFLGGMAVGAESALTPMYVAEVSPRNLRGRMGTLYQLSIVGGILSSYLINYLLRDAGTHNWRWMFATGALPAVLFAIILWRVPESPRYLVLKGRVREATEVLERWMRADEAAREVEAIQASTRGGSAGWRELLRPELKRPLRIGFILAILVHFSGINTIVDYAPRILQSAGWSIDAALFSTFGIGLTMFVFTLVSFRVIDRHGRRPLYIVGSLGMTGTLAGLAYASAIGEFSGTPVFILLIIYIAFFSACIGPVFWTLLPEIFPNRSRGEAITVPVLTQWVANAVVVLLFPVAFDHVGRFSTFGFLAVMALMQAWFCWKHVPETKGRSLEEVQDLWK